MPDQSEYQLVFDIIDRWAIYTNKINNNSNVEKYGLTIDEQTDLVDISSEIGELAVNGKIKNKLLNSEELNRLRSKLKEIPFKVCILRKKMGANGVYWESYDFYNTDI